MSKVRIKLNRSGVRQLLRSAEMREICDEKAAAIAARCGEGYEHGAYTGKNRANASVWAETPQARRDNAENNTILRAMK